MQNEAVFYNPNELGLGRKVNCKRTLNHQACYVTKYGHVGGSPFESFDDTIHNFNPGDTVAMEADRVPPKPSVVRFYIYKPNGKLSRSTLFDTSGPKFVPGVCNHCHGGNEFVVLDPHAYRYPGVSKDSPHSLDKQQEKFRVLNESVAYAHLGESGGPYLALLQRLYEDNWGTPGAKAIPEPIPPAWQDQSFAFHHIFKPSCRTCHMYQTPPLDFERSFTGNGFVSDDVCRGYMPHAMSPMLRLWKTTNPSLLQALSDLAGSAFCQSSSKGKPPKLTVVAPSGSVTTSVQGVTHKATVTDLEDGPNCCKVVWSSDQDGPLGVGKEIVFAYRSVGPRHITVIATDSDGRIDAKVFALNVVSAPPEVPTDLELSHSRFFLTYVADNTSLPDTEIVPTTTGAFPFNTANTPFLLPCGVQNFAGQLQAHLLSAPTPVHWQGTVRFLRADGTVIVSKGYSGTQSFDHGVLPVTEALNVGASAGAGYTPLSTIHSFRDFMYQPADLGANTPVRMELTVTPFADTQHKIPITDSNPANNVINLWLMRACGG